MGHTDQGLPEPSSWHECCQLVCLPRHHKSELLLSAPPRKEARLETIQGKMPAQQAVPVQPGLLQQQEQKGSNAQAGLDISTKEFSVHVTESTPMPLLAAVLEVIRDAQ